MLPQQKEALLTLILWVAGIAALPAVTMLVPVYQTEITYALLALVIIAMWVCRRIVGVKWSDLDERDQGIRFKAGMAGAAGVVTLVVGVCLILSSVFRTAGFVPVFWIARLAFCAMAALYLFWTAAILILYRRGG
jgi:predicted phage tail protein